MNKEITKNREALIRYFYSLPEPDGTKINMYALEGPDTCLCAKGQVMKKFYGMKDYDGPNKRDYPKDTKKTNLPKGVYEGNLCSDISESLDIDLAFWEKIESIYDGHHETSKEYEERSYKAIASWLQTLPGWPRIL